MDFAIAKIQTLICLAKIISAHLHQLLPTNFYFYAPQTYRQKCKHTYVIVRVRPKKKARDFKSQLSLHVLLKMKN